MSHPTLTITTDGRSGTVTYRDAERTVNGYWEIGGGDAVALVHLDLNHITSTPERHKIFRFVAAEVIRQKCPRCTANIDEASGWITLRQ